MSEISREPGNQIIDGRSIDLISLCNDQGFMVELTNWGASWISAYFPGTDQYSGNMLLGYATPEGYITDPFYMGATIGRFANRIGNARFTIGTRDYPLEANEGPHSNHGGFSGFHHKVWNMEFPGNGVVFTLDSRDGEGGYPGNLHVEVFYHLDEENTLTIQYRATTDRATYLNLTNHAYFNLSGSNDILNHRLQINAGKILETSPDYIPTGHFIPVEGSPFNFSSSQLLGKHIFDENQQLIWNRGYNHCFAVNKGNPEIPAAILWEEASGRKMELFTSYPGLLLYTGNYLDSPEQGTGMKAFKPYSGLALEAQYFPDTPHHPHFPSCLLSEDSLYDHFIRFKFTEVIKN